MDCKQWFKEFQQLSPVTQVTLVMFTLAMVLLLAVFPASGTSIITFLVALKMLAAR